MIVGEGAFHIAFGALAERIVSENARVVARIGSRQGLERRGVIAIARSIERTERVPGCRIEREVRAGTAVGDELARGSGAVQKALIGTPGLLKGAASEIAAGSIDTLVVPVSSISDDMPITAEQIRAEDTGHVGVAAVVQGSVARIDSAAAHDILNGRIVVAGPVESVLRLE